MTDWIARREAVSRFPSVDTPEEKDRAAQIKEIARRHAGRTWADDVDRQVDGLIESLVGLHPAIFDIDDNQALIKQECRRIVDALKHLNNTLDDLSDVTLKDLSECTSGGIWRFAELVQRVEAELRGLRFGKATPADAAQPMNAKNPKSINFSVPNKQPHRIAVATARYSIPLYEVVTGRSAGRSDHLGETETGEKKDGGPFVRFLTEIFIVFDLRFPKVENLRNDGKVDEADHAYKGSVVQYARQAIKERKAAV